jgi:hypothetical protein
LNIPPFEREKLLLKAVLNVINIAKEKKNSQGQRKKVQ